MTTPERIGTGFADPAIESQEVFRAALDAVAHPGSLLTLAPAGEPPAGVQPAAALLLLALLDPGTRLWASDRIRATGAAHWLRFHTGCELVDAPADAGFAWYAAPDDAPLLADLDPGSDAYPDRSCTCVIDVPALGARAVAAPWRLSGPGIRDARQLQVAGLDGGFLDQWLANHASFPRGIDVFLAAGLTLCALPRTTAIALEHGTASRPATNVKEMTCTSR